MLTQIPRMPALPGNDASAATVAVGRVLNDPERPMKERFRALFTLRSIGGEEAVNQVHLRLRFLLDTYSIVTVLKHDNSTLLYIL